MFPGLKAKLYLLGLLVSSVLTVISAFLIIQIIPNIIKNEVYKRVIINKETEQYNRFVETPFPIKFKIYFFNVENAEDILKGKKPILKEIGPYVYNEYRRKTISSMDDEEDSVSYRETELFEFDKEASGNLTDKDVITTLNLAMNSLIQIAEQIGAANLMSTCLSDIFPKIDTVFIKPTVKELLFDGLNFCLKHFSLCEFQRIIACKMMESKRNVDKKDDKSLQFSLFNYKNNSNDGLYTINRGNKDLLSLGKILRWNNLTYTKFWNKTEDNKCNKVKGTHSTLFPPQISKNQTFDIYASDVCRSLSLHFAQEKIYKNIKGYEFAPDNSSFRSHSSNQKDNCFCSKQTRGLNGELNCFLDGVIDIQPCTGAPVLLSFPHFLWADKSYIDNIDGVSPDEELHKLFLTIEPETGIPLQAKLRIQLNTVLRPIQHIKETNHLPRVVLPLFWIEEDISLPDKYVDMLQESYFNVVNLVDIIKWICLGGSLFLTLMFASQFILKKHLPKF